MQCVFLRIRFINDVNIVIRNILNEGEYAVNGIKEWKLLMLAQK